MIIAARGGGFNNALGIAPQAKVLPVAMDFNTDNVGATVSEAIRWAVDHGARVLNLSLARPASEPLSPAEIEAVAYAQSKDAILIVSSGNVKSLTGGNNLAKLPGVVAVAATTPTGEEYFGSEQRDYTALAAPGKDIVTIGPRATYATGYSRVSGTSPAAAVVSGVAALVRAKYPTMDAANVINRLIRTAADKGTPGRDIVFGYGIVDAYTALTADVPAVDKNPLGVATVQAQSKTQTNGAPKKKATTGAFIQIGVVLILLAGVVSGIVLSIHAHRRRKVEAGLASAPLTPPATAWPTDATPTYGPTVPAPPTTIPAAPYPQTPPPQPGQEIRPNQPPGGPT